MSKMPELDAELRESGIDPETVDMEKIIPWVFDTGIAFVCEEHTIIVHKYGGGFGIYNKIMTEDEIKTILEPIPFYGLWGSEEGTRRKIFFDLAKEILPRETYLELVDAHGRIR